MNELEYLQSELRYAGNTGWTKGANIHLTQAIHPVLEEAWTHVAVDGWKTDWCRAARHVFLSYALGKEIRTSKAVSREALNMIARWLEGLQPTWTSADPTALVQAENIVERKAAAVELLAHTLYDAVWAVTYEYCQAWNRQYYRRAKILGLAEVHAA